MLVKALLERVRSAAASGRLPEEEVAEQVQSRVRQFAGGEVAAALFPPPSVEEQKAPPPAVDASAVPETRGEAAASQQEGT